MAQTTINNGDTGLTARTAINNNFTELYNDKLTSVQLTDLTDAGDSTLHYHATDRARANHTGTQTASTISDFDAEVENNTRVVKNKTVSIPIACSDETTDLTTGTAKVTFRMPFAMTLTAVRASVTTAPVGSTIIVDINESGTTILSTKITIDASEKTSTTAATPPVISDSSLADDAEITIDIDQIGSSTAGAGLKVYLIGEVT